MDAGWLVAIIVLLGLAALPLASRMVKYSADRQWPDLAAEAEEPAFTPEEAEEAELRQLIEAKSYHRTLRGEEPIDVEAEVERLRREMF